MVFVPRPFAVADIAEALGVRAPNRVQELESRLAPVMKHLEDVRAGLPFPKVSGELQPIGPSKPPPPNTTVP